MPRKAIKRDLHFFASLYLKRFFIVRGTSGFSLLFGFTVLLSPSLSATIKKCTGWYRFKSIIIELAKELLTKIKEGKMSKDTSFKKRLEELLSKRVKEKDGRVDFDALINNKTTYLDLVLIAQIKKACGGDTSSANFLRDTSGNKLKDKAEGEETSDINPFEFL